MLKAIRTDRLLNIMIGVITLLIGGIWYVTSSPGDLYYHLRHYVTYMGIAASVYWCIFWGLQIDHHFEDLKDPEYEAKKMEKKALRAELRGPSIREKLMNKSTIELTIEVLSLRASHAILGTVFGSYAVGIIFYIHFYIFDGSYFSVLPILSAIFLSLFVCISLGRLIYYIYQSYMFRKDIIVAVSEVDPYKVDMLAAIRTASEKMSHKFPPPDHAPVGMTPTSKWEWRDLTGKQWFHDTSLPDIQIDDRDQIETDVDLSDIERE